MRSAHQDQVARDSGCEDHQFRRTWGDLRAAERVAVLLGLAESLSSRPELARCMEERAMALLGMCLPDDLQRPSRLAWQDLQAAEMARLLREIARWTTTPGQWYLCQGSYPLWRGCLDLAVELERGRTAWGEGQIVNRAVD